MGSYLKPGEGAESALKRKHSVLPGVEGGGEGTAGGNLELSLDCSEQFAHRWGEAGWHWGWKEQKCIAESQEELGMF